MKSTKYFQVTRLRPDRSQIKDEWIQQVVQFPEKEQIQAVGRIRRWAKIEDHGRAVFTGGLAAGW